MYIIDLGSLHHCSPQFIKAAQKLDLNGDGQITPGEIKQSTTADINGVRNVCRSDQEWGLLKHFAITKGEYQSLLTGETKSMLVGAGGRFSHLVDQLMTAKGMTYYEAKAVALKAGQEHHAAPQQHYGDQG